MSNAPEFWRIMVRAFAARFASEPAKTASQSPNLAGAGKPHSSDDDDAKRMGSMLIRLGEVIEKPDFMGLRENSPEDAYFDALMNSGHAVWSREDARRLRHDFKDQIGRIIAANRAHQDNEQIAVARALNKTINDLADILFA